MKKSKLFILIVVAITILAIAIPALAQEACPGCTVKGRLVIENQSDQVAFMRLSGPTDYYLTVQPGQTANYTVYVGDYSWSGTSCGDVKSSGSYTQGKGEFRFIVLACSVDVPVEEEVEEDAPIKLVKVAIVNPLSVATSVTLAGLDGDNYSFFLNAGQTKYYTIVARESYLVYCSACGTVELWNNVSVSNNTYVVPCP